ncbi:MAG: metallophosphoesterase [Acidobacteria bacterium]|nr:metallophosphoesterase [Acidobacteriota bacterium]
MTSLLHLSDVHFGPPHRPEVAEGVLALIEERRPQVVVLSGDLTQRAKPEQFRQARRFVERIPVPTLTVPGNHDVPLYRFWERIFAPFAAYRQNFSPDLEPVLELDGVAIVGVNTAHGWTLKDGRISLRRLERLADQIAGLPAETYKIVVAHHQLIPPPGFGSQRVLVNAHETLEVLARSGVDLVLSGHLHQAYTATSEEYFRLGLRPVRILHSGTSTSSRGRGPERRLNTCNWIRFDEATVSVSHLQWHPEIGRFEERSRHFFGRPEDASLDPSDVDCSVARP